MDYPDFIRAAQGQDVPIPDTVVRTHAFRSDAGLVVLFDFLQDFALPPHSHKGQWVRWSVARSRSPSTGSAGSTCRVTAATFRQAWYMPCA